MPHILTMPSGEKPCVIATVEAELKFHDWTYWREVGTISYPHRAFRSRKLFLGKLFVASIVEVLENGGEHFFRVVRDTAKWPRNPHPKFDTYEQALDYLKGAIDG